MIGMRLAADHRSNSNVQTVNEMPQFGWFTGAVVWRWIDTDAAHPYITGELFDVFADNLVTSVTANPEQNRDAHRFDRGQRR